MKLYVLLYSLLLSAPAYGYVGRGAGLGDIGALLGVVAAVFFQGR